MYSISITQVIVSIMDPSMSTAVVSEEPMVLSPEMVQFFSEHLVRVMADEDLKACKVEGALRENLELGFVDFSALMANRLFRIARSNPGVPVGDLAAVEFYCEGTHYWALLKMGYSRTYVHNFDNGVVSILPYLTTLPNISQRVREAVLFDRDARTLKVLETPVEIDGVKENYLSKYLMGCKTARSSKEQYAAVKNALGRVLKHYYAGDATMRLRAALELADGVQIDGGFDLEDYASELFGAAPGVQDAFLEAVERCGISEKVLHFSGKTLEAIGKPQTIKTDAGIEVKLPLHLCTDPDYIEITTDARGKQQILIKNINLIK